MMLRALLKSAANKKFRSPSLRLDFRLTQPNKHVLIIAARSVQNS
jgi:hypothetical protein